MHLCISIVTIIGTVTKSIILKKWYLSIYINYIMLYSISIIKYLSIYLSPLLLPLERSIQGSTPSSSSLPLDAWNYTWNINVLIWFLYVYACVYLVTPLKEGGRCDRWNAFCGFSVQKWLHSSPITFTSHSINNRHSIKTNFNISTWMHPPTYVCRRRI